MRTTLLLAGLTALLLVMGQRVGEHTGMMFALVLAAAMNFGSCWFSDKIVLRLYRAREASPQEAPVLYRTVRGLASALRRLGAASGRMVMPAAEQNPSTAHLFIVNPLHGRNLAQLFSTHPPLEERIRRLEAIQPSP